MPRASAARTRAPASNPWHRLPGSRALPSASSLRKTVMPQDISLEACTSSQIYRLRSLQKSPVLGCPLGARSTVLTQREPWRGGGGWGGGRARRRLHLESFSRRQLLLQKRGTPPASHRPLAPAPPPPSLPSAAPPVRVLRPRRAPVPGTRGRTWAGAPPSGGRRNCSDDLPSCRKDRGGRFLRPARRPAWGSALDFPCPL